MVEANTPVVPSLHALSDPLLRTPANVAIYLIQFMFANPGRTSSINEGEMMSWRRLSAEFGAKRIPEMAGHISKMLSTSLNHYFPDGQYTVTCNIDEEAGTGDDGTHLGNYAITINITDADGTPIISSSKWRAALNGNDYSMIN